MKQRISLTLGLVLCWWMGSAQTYPVQVSTTIIPPYSIYLSDYATSEKIALNLLFNDPVRFELGVKLKLTIEGQGITLTTKPEYIADPIYLQSGFPERLSGADLAPYFDPRNLNFQGLNRSQFDRTAALPEGVYRFCVEVIEYTQNKKVSNTACAVAWMILNDPPIINSPRNGQKITIQDPQLVVFNWTPRHTGSPNAAFSTEYDFELVEVRSNDRNPNNAILSSPPVYTATTQSTSLYYGIAETPLIPGQQYAFRVRARAQAGVDELDLFKNQGYSEVFTFVYGDRCVSPDAIKIEALSPTSIQGSWTSLPAHTAFTVQFKENKENAQWFEKSSLVNKATIGSLRPDTEYRVQVVGFCGIVSHDNVTTYTVKTPKAEANNFVCGAEADVVNVDNTTPIGSLIAGQFIESGNFRIGLAEVSANADGTFNGRGVAYVPWLRLAGLKVVFKSIKVNEAGKVYAGNVVSVQSSNSDWVVNIPGQADDDMPADGNGNENDGDSADEQSGEDVHVEVPVVIVDGTIESVTRDDDGNLVVTDTEGNVTVVKDANGVVKDSAGNAYTVDQGGNIVKTSEGDGDAAPGSPGPAPGNGGSPSVTNEDLQLLKGAIARVRDQTDFTKLDELENDFKFRSSELKGSVDNEREMILRNTSAIENTSSANVIVLHESKGEINDITPWGTSVFKSYKDAEQAYNTLRILQIICRRDIKDEELLLLGSRLMVEEKSLADFIAARKNAGESAEDIQAVIGGAIIKLAALQYDVK